MRWHVAILPIALVLSRWPLSTDSQIHEPSLAAQLLSNGRVCSDWSISAAFPDFCAFALYRCILKKYFLKTFRCPGVIIQKLRRPQTTMPEEVPDVIALSTAESVLELHGTLAPTTTSTESALPVLLTAIATSTVAEAEVSPETSSPDTAMSTTVEDSDIVISSATTIAQSLLENHAVSIQEPLPELPPASEVVLTTEPVPEILIATPATTTAVPLSSLYDSTTAEFSFESLATASTIAFFSKPVAVIAPITPITPIPLPPLPPSPPPFVLSPTHSLIAQANLAVGISSPPQNVVKPAVMPPRDQRPKLIAGHFESQVSIVTLNALPQKVGPKAQEDPVPEINSRDLFLRLQDSQVQHLVRETQDLLAKGKQEQELQATSLQLLKALNLANVQKKAKLGIMLKSQEQASNKTQL